MSIKDGILNPKSFFLYSSSNTSWYTNSTGSSQQKTYYYNLWSGTFNGTDHPDDTGQMTKTVYDPSPVGYKVPTSQAFSNYEYTSAPASYNCGYTFSNPYIYFTGGGYRPSGNSSFTGKVAGNTQAYFWSNCVSSNGSNGYNSYAFWLGSTKSWNNYFCSPLFDTQNSYGALVRPVTE